MDIRQIGEMSVSPQFTGWITRWLRVLLGRPMRIRLTRKLANQLNGIDVAHSNVGDVIDLPRREAQLLLAEGWARHVSDDHCDGHTKSPRRRRKKLGG